MVGCFVLGCMSWCGGAMLRDQGLAGPLPALRSPHGVQGPSQEHRWNPGSLLATAPEVIRKHWNLQSFLDRGKFFRSATAADMNDNESDFDHESRYTSVSKMATLVDSAIQSNFVWAFIELLHSLNSVLTSMTDWAHGCPCHGRAVRQVSWPS